MSSFEKKKEITKFLRKIHNLQYNKMLLPVKILVDEISIPLQKNFGDPLASLKSIATIHGCVPRFKMSPPTIRLVF
jgi:hypothetical protein